VSNTYLLQFLDLTHSLVFGFTKNALLALIWPWTLLVGPTALLQNPWGFAANSKCNREARKGGEGR